jgi:hypothetical protein
VFPSQHLADRHSRKAIEIVDQLRRSGGNQASSLLKRKKGKKSATRSSSSKFASQSSDNASNVDKQNELSGFIPSRISDREAQWIHTIRTLTSCPGVAAELAEETVGRPYADAMRKMYQKYPTDPDITYGFAESLMVLNAWQLYEYPSGRPLSADVVVVQRVLEECLDLHPRHPGLCHMYVHLSEMSATPHKALRYCEPLRTSNLHAGHLVHMSSHIGM